jgi:hypothetical protein
MDPITEPIPNEQNDNEEEQIEQLPKKKELSQKQIDHLNNIRVKALERKREIKLQKHEEYKKQAMEKKVQQIELNTPCAAVTPSRQEPIKQEPKQEPIKQEPIKQEPKQEEVKPKKKVLKKVIKYVEADEDDDDDDEVIITKPKKKEKQIEAQNIKQPELSYSDLLYQTSLERLQTKMLSERAKSIVHSVIPHYY